MRSAWIWPVLSLWAITGCAGLTQFPVTSVKYQEDLKVKDPDYDAAVTVIGKASTDEARVQARNDEIDRRLRVIDLNFDAFVEALAKENVRANFGIALAQVGLGAAGSLVGETASQILSAASGGLAGAQQAYGKAILYDQAFSALLAQMMASRKAVLVKIYEGRAATIGDYPLSTAVQDIGAYYFAGTLPGAVVATSADAKVKNDQAEDKLAKFRTNPFTEDESAILIRKFVRPPDGKPTDTVNQENLKRLHQWLGTSPVAGIAIANFLSNKELRSLREQAIREIPIPRP